MAGRRYYGLRHTFSDRFRRTRTDRCLLSSVFSGAIYLYLSLVTLPLCARLSRHCSISRVPTCPSSNTERDLHDFSSSGAACGATHLFAIRGPRRARVPLTTYGAMTGSRYALCLALPSTARSFLPGGDILPMPLPVVQDGWMGMTCEQHCRGGRGDAISLLHDNIRCRR